jgi:hypothetical protein
MRDKKCIQHFFLGKPQEKRVFRRFGHIPEENIKMDLKEMGCADVDSINLRIGTASGLL